MASRKRRASRKFEWEAVPDHDNDDLPRPNVRIKHTHLNIDNGGPSSSRTTYISAPASPTKKGFSSTYDLYGSSAWNNESVTPGKLEQLEADKPLDPAYAHHLDVNEPGPPRPKKISVNNPMRRWLDDRDEFLKEIIRLDGRADNDREAVCRCCENAVPAFRCEDCHGGEMVCSRCIVDLHIINPFHRIEHWEDGFFKPITLKALGLRVQLGHHAGEHCPNPQAAAGDDFVVLDTTGIHQIGLDYCSCEHVVTLSCQLICARLYPATVMAPKTAATFNVLEFFHLLTFESKASVFEFFNTLSWQTDNTGTVDVPDRYPEFLRVIHQWRHLKMLKRAGRGHDPGGAKATQEGECAVLFPVCPHPDKNLPPDWQEAPEQIRWLFALFQGGDANFRMIWKKVSSEEVDPTLSPGLSYFVEIKKYYSHLAEYGDQKDVCSTCVKHHAVKDANTGRFSNLASSGIGTMDCTRHNMKRPNSVGDLQKGEKYVNVDYLFFSSLLKTVYMTIVMSYDIVCQWSVHVWQRMFAFPHHFHFNNGTKQVTFLVPKFHLPAHVAACQTAFSFNLTRGVGQTNREAPEHGWADINLL